MSKPTDRNDFAARPGPVKQVPRRNTEFVSGNTLDYYNDDLSRKAVGRLIDSLDGDIKAVSNATGELDKLDEPEAEAEEVYVKGFDKALPETVKPEEEEPPAERVRRAREPKAKAPEEPKETPPEEAEKEDARDFDFSMYRKKERTRNVGAKPAPTPTRSHDQRAKKAVDLDEKAPPSKLENSEFDDFQAKYSKRDYIPSSKSSVSSKNGAFADNAGGGISVFSIAIVGIGLIFLVILFVLVIRMQALDTQLLAAQEELKNVTDSNYEVGNLELEIEGKDTQIATLQDEVNSLKQQLAAAAPPSPAEGEPGAQTPSPSQSGTPSQEQTYIVQPGDSFNKISKTLFDSEKYGEAIKQANGYSPDDNNIQPGQVLKIPPIS